MAVDKQLKFTFALDTGSFDAVKRALDELINKSKELAKVLSGIQVPGSGGGQAGQGLLTSAGPGGASTNVSQLNVGMDKRAVESIDRVTDAYGRQAKAVKELGQAMGGLRQSSLGPSPGGMSLTASAYQDVLRTHGAAAALAGRTSPYGASQPDFIDKMVASQPRKDLFGPEVPFALAPDDEKKIANAATSLAGIAALTQKKADDVWTPKWGERLGGFLTQDIGKGGISVQGAMSSPMGLIQSILGGSSGAAIAARSLGAIGAGVQGAMNLGQGFNMGYTSLETSRMQAVRPQLDALRKGDMSNLMAEQAWAGMDSQQQLELARTVTGSEAEAKRWLSSAAGAVGTVVTGSGAGVAGFSDAGRATERYKAQQQVIKAIQQTDTGVSIDWAQERVGATRGTRLALGRAGMGMGFGSRVDAQGNTVIQPDKYLDWEKKEIASGWEPGDIIPYFHQARGLGFNRGEFSGTMRSASYAGFGQVGSVLQGAGMGGGQDQAMFLTRAALGGGIGTAAGLQLGSSLFGFDPRGTVSGAGALAAIQGGFQFTGGIGDMTSVARAQMGMRGGDAAAAGFDPYQKGMNILSAVSAMPGSTTYAQDALAGRMSFKELLEVAEGGKSARASAYGIGQTQAMAQIGGMGSGIFSRYVEQGGSDPVSVAMRKMRESGLGEAEYMRTLGGKARKGNAGAKAELEVLGIVASDLSGFSTEEGMGLVSIMSGIGSGKLGGKGKGLGSIPGGSIDAMERKQRESLIETMEKENKALKEQLPAFVNSLTKAGERLGSEKGFGALTTNLETFNEHLTKINANLAKLLGEGGAGSTTAAVVKTAASSPLVRAGGFVLPGVGGLIGIAEGVAGMASGAAAKR